MLQINKLRSDHVIDYAAEELKKYLRMMMPQDGDIAIAYAPEAETGFRLGLAEDFGLTFDEVADPALDDLVYIETDLSGGILAGSNPRSVLFAVYRYLKENGCRFLYPGVDGEFIPMQHIIPVSRRHLASSRFRGWCNEGAEFQQNMLETIDFAAKLEMNVYMIEFDIPYTYYGKYYNHVFNDANRPPEPVNPALILQWKRQCETEIAKRGLQFHDMGHGWTAEPFGLSSALGWERTAQEVPPETAQYLAELNGKRELFGGVPLNTNLCMSNSEVRTIMANAIADYAANHQNADYIHVWLADGSRNHCECENCRKMRPSDFYVQMLNQLDGIMEERQLKSKIVFIAYVDTLFAPLENFVKNTERFALLYAPIQRSYTSSIRKEKISEPPEYIRNHWPSPVSAEENAAFLLDWQKNWKGCCFCYEYHFWRHMCLDPSGLAISRRIYEDILALPDVSLDGIVEDGSQRAFFPNGLAMYVYAAALLDRSRSYEDILEDYFRHAYGEAWEDALAYLTKISEVFAFDYMEGECSEDSAKGAFYAPSREKLLRQVPEITEKWLETAEKYRAPAVRAQSVSLRLLELHTEYSRLLSELMLEKALNGTEKRAKFEKLCNEFGRHEAAIERYFDHYLHMATLSAGI